MDEFALFELEDFTRSGAFLQVLFMIFRSHAISESIIYEVVFIEFCNMRKFSFLGHIVDNLFKVVIIFLINTFDCIHGSFILNYLILIFRTFTLFLGFVNGLILILVRAYRLEPGVVEGRIVVHGSVEMTPSGVGGHDVDFVGLFLFQALVEVQLVLLAHDVREGLDGVARIVIYLMTRLLRSVVAVIEGVHDGHGNRVALFINELTLVTTLILSFLGCSSRICCFLCIRFHSRSRLDHNSLVVLRRNGVLYSD